MSAAPRISLVVVNHNGGELARRAIDSALSQDYPDYEVIVVDNGSDDDSLSGILRSTTFQTSSVRTRVVRLARNMGCAGGRNAGIQAAKGDLIAFLDSDAVAPSGWLAAAAETMSTSDRVGIVASTSLSMRNPRILQSQGGVVTMSGHAIDLGFGEPWEFSRIDEAPIYAMGNGLVARRELFEQLGRFDEICRNYYEDVDFCLRAQLAGYEVRPCRVEPLLHFGGFSNESFGDKEILLARHRIRTALKLYGGAMFWRFLGWELLSLLSGGSGTSRLDHLDAWRWNLARLGSVVSSRRRFRHRVRAARSLRGMRQIWGPARSPDHSILYAPEGGDLEAGIAVGDKDSRAIAYGFYWEESGQGESFRWSNGLGCLLVRSMQPIRRLRLRLHFLNQWQTDPGLCLVVLLDRARDVFFAGQIEVRDVGWRDYEWSLEAPRGNYELLLISRPTALEAHGWGRSLGVALASVRCL